METSSEHPQGRSFFVTSKPVQFSRLILLIICVMAWGLYSCSDTTTGIDGNGNGNGNGNDNGNGDEIGTEPTFANVGQIFQSHCAPCHITQTTNGVQLNNHSNVLGSEGVQYGENVVKPGDADGSPLVDKIASSNPQFGERMPQGGPPFLSDERIEQIKEWIDEGAENN